MFLMMIAACLPDPALVVVSAEEVGTVPRSEAIQGRDGGPSGLAFGRSVWTYGDTVLNAADADGTNWHTNSWDHVDPASWRDGAAPETPVDEVGAPGFFIELTDEEKAWDAAHAAEDCAEPPCGVRWALWPSQPLVDEASGRAWVLYGLLNEELPSGIGVASWDGLDQPVVRHEVDGSWFLFPEPELGWANAPVVADGHLYTFGCPLRGFARPCHLARVPLASVDDRSAWRFLGRDGWSADAEDRVKLFDGAPIMEVSFVEALDQWLLVYADAFSRTVHARTAPTLEGPWSAEIELFEVDGEAPYDAVQHAELAEDDGRIQWVTYSRPTGEGWFGAEHALWRVEIEAR
jgi:hypothetical protein